MHLLGWWIYGRIGQPECRTASNDNQRQDAEDDDVLFLNGGFTHARLLLCLPQSRSLWDSGREKYGNST